jgi:hypothetical protein
LATWTTDNRTYFRTYARQRNVPSVDYNGQLAVGGQLPSSVVVYPIEGDAAYTRYRYTRLNNRYVVLDQTGRIIDLDTSPTN